MLFEIGIFHDLFRFLKEIFLNLCEEGKELKSTGSIYSFVLHIVLRKPFLQLLFDGLGTREFLL